MHELQRLVADTADRLGLHASAATLLVDLQVRLGTLGAEVVRGTEHGRRPFRLTPGWEPILGDLAFALVSLADQTGVDVDRAVRAAADRLYHAGLAAPRPDQRSDGWPLSG